MQSRSPALDVCLLAFSPSGLSFLPYLMAQTSHFFRKSFWINPISLVSSFLLFSSARIWCSLQVPFTCMFLHGCLKFVPNLESESALDCKGWGLRDWRFLPALQHWSMWKFYPLMWAANFFLYLICIPHWSSQIKITQKAIKLGVFVDIFLHL